jgi:glycosyltransferase involved in cell wall biosynthesis
MDHVALVIPTLDRLAGAERQVLLLAKGLLARGWRVSVVALSGSGTDAVRDLTSAGAAFLSLEMRKGLADPRGWTRFRRWIRQQSPDVIHAHLPHAAWMARWSRLLAPTRVVIDSVHTSATGTLGRRLGYRWSNWLPDCVSVVSAGAAKAYVSAGMVSPRRLILLSNGLDHHHWHRDPSARLQLRRHLGLSHEFLWLAAGRLEPVKDYPSLLRAMTELPKTARLIVAGAGPEEGKLRRLSVELGLEARVRFLGFEHDVLPWMQAADGFVLCSRWEGLPMSLLEAGACALPAVVTDVPGSREIIVDGRNGFLVPSEDFLSLSSAMSRLMRLACEERDAMGTRGCERVLGRFSIETVLDQWEALYRNLLDSHPRPLAGPGQLCE